MPYMVPRMLKRTPDYLDYLDLVGCAPRYYRYVPVRSGRSSVRPQTYAPANTWLMEADLKLHSFHRINGLYFPNMRIYTL